MYLFFDTETTGLPKNWKAPVEEIDNWPRLVQIAWLIYDKSGDLVSKQSEIIKPNGFTIPEESSEIHGITTEIAERDGVELAGVLESIHMDISESELIIAHNIAFDEKILGAEFIRNGFYNVLAERCKTCTMLSSTEFCGIPGQFGTYKWPTLSELHIELFGEDFSGAHDALADIEATAACFWELKGRGVITSEASELQG